MKILFLCRLFHQFRGGLESYTYEMARALAKRGHHVHIVCENKGNFYRHNLGEGIRVHAIRYNEAPFAGSWKINSVVPLHDILYSRKAAEKINELIDTFGVDVVEVPDVQEQGFWYAQNKKSAFVLRLHGWFSCFLKTRSNAVHPHQHLKFREQIFWHMQKNSILKADGLCAVSSDFKEFAREIWHLNEKQIEVIHHAVDLQTFHPSDAKQELAVLFVGLMENNKGIKVLAQALPIVLQEFPKMKFYFAGRNTRLENSDQTAQDYILKYSPQENVVFLGELSTSDLIPYYQKIAIGVFPSLYEPFGIVALESIACGCATIVSNIGGFKDTIEHEKEGLLVPPGDPAQLASAMKRFLNDETLRERCCAQALKKVKTNFTMDQLVEQTLLVYQRAIHNYRQSSVRNCNYAQSERHYSHV